MSYQISDVSLLLQNYGSTQVYKNTLCSYIIHYNDGSAYRIHRLVEAAVFLLFLDPDKYLASITTPENIQYYTEAAKSWEDQDHTGSCNPSYRYCGMQLERECIRVAQIILQPAPIDGTLIELQNQVIVANQLNEVATAKIAELKAENTILSNRIEELNNQIAVQELTIRELEKNQQVGRNILNLLISQLNTSKELLKACLEGS